jgi:transcription initiation factor IIE alpha subunit
MNFNDLQQIVKHLKKTLTCSQCNKPFINDDIEVISSYEEQALFHANCFHCHNQLLVHVTMSDKIKGKNPSLKKKTAKTKNQLSEREHLGIRSRSKSIISTNDVIDMHTFLNKFNGDFKKLFSN